MNKILEPAKRVYRRARGLYYRSMESLDNRLNERVSGTDFPPVFILGAPRTGTTLIYQCLCQSLELSYLCNFASGHFRYAATATALASKVTTIEPPESYANKYGTTAGWSAPSQGNKFWARWFPSDQSYVSKVDDKALRQVVGSVARMEKACKTPFINKVQGHCARVLPLTEAFPDAVFIKVGREYVPTVQSILRGRRKFHKDEEQWFSVKPSSFESIRQEPLITQICLQIKGVEDDIARDLAQNGKCLVVDISYEDFCKDPRGFISDFSQKYLAETGYDLKVRRECPASFTIDNDQKLPDDEYEQVVGEVQKIWPNGSDMNS